jgi:hypothetical protein
MEAIPLVLLKKENQLLTAIGLSTLTVVISIFSFNVFAFTESLNQEFLFILVGFFILIVTAHFYFVHTVLISQLGLVYISNKREKVVLWSEIGSVEVLSREKNNRNQRLLIRHANGKLMRGFPAQMLLVDIDQAAALISSHIQ